MTFQSWANSEANKSPVAFLLVVEMRGKFKSMPKGLNSAADGGTEVHKCTSVKGFWKKKLKQTPVLPNQSPQPLQIA